MHQQSKRLRPFVLPLSVLAVLTVGRLDAHPHHQMPPTRRQAAQKRVPLRATRPPRNAPDDQTRPLEAGTRPAHSSPIYVTINDELPAVKASAEYMVARLDATLDWLDAKAMWSSDAYKDKALASFEQAKRFYEAVLRRAQ